ncbi:MAG TPA: major capsid protein [Flavitalea sp.]|nr:major capsid protein [Flavitalea sp.]
MTEAPAQVDLKFDAVVGHDRVAAAASVVDSDAPAPLRSRRAIEKYSGKIPAIKEKFRLSQDDMRNIEIIRALGIAGDTLYNYVVRDTEDAAISGDKRIDLMLLQAMSTLQIDVNLTNNPDGAYFGVIDLLGNATTQKQGVPVIWSTAATAKPTQDIDNFLEINRNTRGRTFGRIMMSLTAWNYFKNTVDVRSNLASFYNTGKAGNTFAVTLNNVNEYMNANQWPNIEVINYQVNVEVDGASTFINPWDAEAVVFIPAGKVGTLFNAVSMEKFHPVAGKSYANFGPTLVSKWADQDPLVEYTAMEMNAFPSVNIDSVFILKTQTVQASFV